ncbi:MAG: undecaprenyldiphospho-muramoylpentapeptide beta-N-acetylglucosaminyltransferase, partial [Eudoraea sp.]|nr:undecaprenyldiphospho-muramoylpentapeptide beta-N-acetylglucosaminyltransferase [Eudoraea sp.]
MDNYRFILSGGGTGGHIYPAIAIANALKERYPNAKFLFVGARDRMEMEKVPQAGYNIKGLWISGLQRKLTLKNLLFPIKLISSLIKAGKIVSEFKPDLVVGTGGFASGPLLRVASKRGIPCVLQEQNSFAGLTNKLLASRAARICVAYDKMERYFPKEKIVKTGNPVRDHIAAITASREEAYAFFGLDSEKRTLLVLGGSLGSKRINELVLDQLPLFEEIEVQLLWQCGKGYFDQYERYTNPAVKVLDFVNRMDLAYAAADVIISRAGASSVSELCIVGKPVIFIPSPNVAEDHQTKNAMALVARSAALMAKEEELD